MPTLYELADNAQRLLDALTDISQQQWEAESGQPRVDWEAERDYRAGAVAREYLTADGAIEQKLDSYGLVMNELTASCEARTAEAKRLKALADADSRAIEAMKSTVDFVLGSLGYKPGDKLKTDHFNITRQFVGGKLPLIVDEEKCPLEWFDMVPKLNTDRVREFIGSDPENWSAFARLGERKTRVAFR